MMGTKEDFTIVCGWITIVAVSIIFGTGKLYSLIGAGVNGKEAASKGLGNVGIAIFIWDVKAGEGVENFGSDSLDGIVHRSSSDDFIVNNVAAEAEHGEKQKNNNWNEFVAFVLWLRLRGRSWLIGHNLRCGLLSNRVGIVWFHTCIF